MTMTDTPARKRPRPSAPTQNQPAQIIADAAGNPAFAVLPWADYERLRDTADADTVARIHAVIGDGEVEVFPGEIFAAIAAGESPIRVFREYRNLTQAALAEAAAIDQGYLSRLETGQHDASVKTLRSLARALRLDLEMMLPPEAE